MLVLVLEGSAENKGQSYPPPAMQLFALFFPNLPAHVTLISTSRAEGLPLTTLGTSSPAMAGKQCRISNVSMCCTSIKEYRHDELSGHLINMFICCV